MGKQKTKTKAKRTCRDCNGQGVRSGVSGWPCPTCKGRKVV